MSSSVRAKTRRTKRSRVSKYKRTMRAMSQFGTTLGLTRKAMQDRGDTFLNAAKSKEKTNDNN